MRAIEPIAKLDLAFSIFCLQHKFNQPIARVSKAVSHTGDGHLYALFGALAWWLDGQHGQYFLLAGLLAFAIELPIYWGLKNSFQRRRPQARPCSCRAKGRARAKQGQSHPAAQQA